MKSNGKTHEPMPEDAGTQIPINVRSVVERLGFLEWELITAHDEIAALRQENEKLQMLLLQKGAQSPKVVVPSERMTD
jgi:hypothetical protein